MTPLDEGSLKNLTSEEEEEAKREANHKLAFKNDAISEGDELRNTQNIMLDLLDPYRFVDKRLVANKTLRYFR